MLIIQNKKIIYYNYKDFFAEIKIMKKLFILFAGLSLLGACCSCDKESKEVQKAKEAANDFRAILHEQELFIQKNHSCSGELDKLSKTVAEKYKGNIAIDSTCNMLIRAENGNLLLRAIADPVNGYRLYACGPMGLYLTAEGFERNCGNIAISGARASRSPQEPAAASKGKAAKK